MLKKLLFSFTTALTFTASAQVLNPDVTQATIGKTICVPGWTATVRPPVSYTNKIKKKLLAEAGLPESDAPLYELDHDEPIELGGAPRDPRNLVLQLWKGPDGAHKKDVVETRMKRLVCVKRISLATAQKCMHDNWHTCPLK